MKLWLRPVYTVQVTVGRWCDCLLHRLSVKTWLPLMADASNSLRLVGRAGNGWVSVQVQVLIATLRDHRWGLVYEALCLFTPQLSLGTHHTYQRIDG